MSQLAGEDGTLEDRARASIASRRREAGWSQAELARRMVELGHPGFNQMMVSRTEKGERPLRVSELEGFAQAFGVEPSMLWHTELARLVGDTSRELEESRSELGAATTRYINAQRRLAGLLDEEINNIEASERAIQAMEVLAPPQIVVNEALREHLNKILHRRPDGPRMGLTADEQALVDFFNAEFAGHEEGEFRLFDLWRKHYEQLG